MSFSCRRCNILLTMKFFKPVITAIFSFLAFSASAASADAEVLNDISNYVYPSNITAKPWAMTYMPDGKTYLQISKDGKKIVKFDIATGEVVDTVLNVEKTRETKIDEIQGFTLSRDASRILVYNSSEMIYRRSFTAKYYVYEVKRNILKPLSDEHKRQQCPLFSPDGLMVAFVADNNIYLKKLVYGTEVPVTTDGEKNKIINGATDWVYEEEFVSTSLMAWSEDNTTLCYVKSDESAVKTYSLAIYGGSCGMNQEYIYYPGQLTYKYPVAGEVNSTVSLHSYDVDTRKNKLIDIDDSQLEYIPRIAYIPGGDRLIVSTLNREQNRLAIYSVNPKSAVVKSILVEEDPAWIKEVTYSGLTYENDGFVIMLPRGEFVHLFKYSYAGAFLGQLTSGDYNVTSYYGKDAAGNIYFQSTSTGAINRVVNCIEKKTGKMSLLSPEKGSSSAVFSPTMEYFMLNSSSSTVPPVYTINVTAKRRQLRVIEDNAAIAQKYSGVCQKEFFTITTPEAVLNAYMVKPEGFDANKRYPVIMYQYSGPSSQMVLDRWEIDWVQYAAKEGFLVVCVDGRGTGGRERRFETSVYKRLGELESIDQIAAARYVASLPYVDDERIGITGWSYGGYETLMAISTDGAPYKAAVAIAPVTDWRFYDTIYTERFMSTPQINGEGYVSSAPIGRIDDIGDTELLIMYGTLDDNVHPANTLEYVSRLQSYGILCNMFVFPNMNHSINGCNARAVVYANMMKFFNQQLK